MRILLFLASLVIFHSLAHAEIEWSGYGSIVAGKVIGGEVDPSGEKEFQVDLYDYAFYTEEFNFKPESMFALQARYDWGNNLTITGQLVAKGADNFRPELDWLYLTYNFSDDAYLMAGRRNLPMYYFSEYMEIGYAYPWIRPPANLYWWEITQFNGLTVAKSFNVGNWTLVLGAFAGSEEREDIEAHDFWRERGFYYFPDESAPDVSNYVKGSADVTWSDIRGINVNASNGWIDLRASYFETHYETWGEYLVDPDRLPVRSTANAVTEFDLQFIGLSGSFDLNLATVVFDYNLVLYDDGYGFEFPTYLVIAIYNHATWQPYVGMSNAAGKLTKDYFGFGTGDAEEHRMYTLGLRYNFHPSASLKIQYDDFNDNGLRGTGLGSTASDYDFSYHNDAQLFSVSVDFVF